MRARLALLLAALLSGCLAQAPPDPAPSAGDASAPSLDAGWPSLESARIRPGVQHGFAAPGVAGVFEVKNEISDCTGNFIFRSRDNASLFLGTAAHCVDELEPGDVVLLDRGAANGTLFYSAWRTLAERNVTDEDAYRAQDFALLRIHDDFRPLVHPAVLHWGGPTGLADPARVERGDPVLAFGNSDLRRGPEEPDRHEGCVSRVTPQGVILHLRGPAVPGDSGSPALLASGEALGVLARVGTSEEAKRGNVVATSLRQALDFAREEAGVDVELVTWPLLEKPAVPMPCNLVRAAPELPAARLTT